MAKAYNHPSLLGSSSMIQLNLLLQAPYTPRETQCVPIMPAHEHLQEHSRMFSKVYPAEHYSCYKNQNGSAVSGTRFIK